VGDVRVPRTVGIVGRFVQCRLLHAGMRASRHPPLTMRAAGLPAKRSAFCFEHALLKQ
jgi:hypothetical protein